MTNSIFSRRQQSENIECKDLEESIHAVGVKQQYSLACGRQIPIKFDFLMKG
jgi:hypothetical protein